MGVIDTSMQSWLFLAGAILLEVAGTSAMKFSDGLSRFWPTLLIFVFYFLAFAALTFALRSIELGIAYAVWAGLGTALIAAVGVFCFNEPFGWLKAGSVLLIILGVAGLHLSGGAGR